ncbi:5755_t:CDS:1, partial [Funneliformis caledonium]
MEESNKGTYECDSVLSEFSENTFNSENPSVELNENDTYSSEKNFVLIVKAYAKRNGFQ